MTSCNCGEDSCTICHEEKCYGTGSFGINAIDFFPAFKNIREQSENTNYIKKDIKNCIVLVPKLFGLYNKVEYHHTPYKWVLKGNFGIHDIFGRVCGREYTYIATCINCGEIMTRSVYTGDY